MRRPTVRSPEPVDKFVGDRIRMQRIAMGMSQTILGEACGVAFQQVQKYEKGLNRVGAGRLQRIATALGETIEFFYRDVDKDTHRRSPQRDVLAELLGTSGGFKLAEAYLAMDGDTRHSLVDVAQTIVAGSRQPHAKAA